MAEGTIDQALQLAIQQHRAGRLADAENTCRQILARQPNHSGTLHLLGVIAIQTGRLDAAIELIRKAIASAPSVADYHNNLGAALRDRGLLDEAIAAYRDALRLQSGNAMTHVNLGVALRDKGQLDEAIASYRHALRLNPNYAEAHHNVGVALVDKGLFEEAVTACRHAVKLKPDYAAAHVTLGVALIGKGEADEAIAAYRRALRLKPDFAIAHNNLGKALRDKGQLDEAIVVLRDAVRIRPDYAEAYSNLGAALSEQGLLDEAIAAYRESLRLKPDFAVAHNNLGKALYEKRQVNEAIDVLRDALRLKPEYAEAHYNLAIALLLKGNFAEAWPHYEWRWRGKDSHSWTSEYENLLWDGTDLNGRTIWLHAEQGFGDTIQFVRYVPMVINRGGKVILQCQPELRGLLQSFAGIERVIDIHDPVPDFDVHSPLLSLPRMFGTRMESIPAPIPYLFPNKDLSRQWAELLAESDKLKVGIVWAGSARHKNDRNRSLSLSLLAPMANIAGVEFHSLQKGEAAGQVEMQGIKLIDHTARLNDFADTAALVANLDLVISVDTSVAHLVGAMGKPVWVLLPFAPDWRWLMDRQDSPWYPTMRLFRQKSLGDWTEAIEEVARALVDFSRQRSAISD